MADEELARRLQESQEVRAPIAPKRDILAGDAGLFDPSIAWSSSSRERSRCIQIIILQDIKPYTFS